MEEKQNDLARKEKAYGKDMKAVPRATEGLSDKIVDQIRILRLFLHLSSVLGVLPLPTRHFSWC